MYAILHACECKREGRNNKTNFKNPREKRILGCASKVGIYVGILLTLRAILDASKYNKIGPILRGTRFDGGSGGQNYAKTNPNIVPTRSQMFLPNYANEQLMAQRHVRLLHEEIYGPMHPK